MHIVGHRPQLEELEQAATLPAVLLQGPSGIGKWLIARSRADEMGGAAITLRDGPTVEDARQMASLYQQRPIGGRSTVSLVDLDECSERVQNVLLKTLEELPSWGRVILVASREPLPTVRSRCHTIRFYRLSDAEVSQVLVDQGSSPAEAASMCLIGDGSVERALRFREAMKEKPRVMQYLDAVARHDRVALTTMLHNWSAGGTVLLWRWMTEVLSDWPQVFTKAELSVVHRIGVHRFYAMLAHLRSGDPVDVVAMQVWKIK